MRKRHCFFPPREFPVFFLLSFFLPLFFSCGGKTPVITSISPRIGTLGEVLTISGENFGKEQNESYVTIAGTAPTGSSYLEWRNDSISLRIPEFGDSGLIYVYVKGRKSNGALFSNQASIPRPVQGSGSGSGPRVFQINPRSGAVGSLVTITGSGFGGSREKGGVFFAWNAEPSLQAPAGAQKAESIEASEADFGYEYWSEQEIRVRVPDGAVSGNIQVKTTQGLSRPFYFEVSGKPGTKTYRDKRSYTISYSVDIEVDEANSPNTLYLWVPRPEQSASQRNGEVLSRSMEPFIESHRGTTLFQFSNLKSKTGVVITQDYRVEVYAQESSVRREAIRPDRETPITAQYTLPSSLIPSDNQDIKAQAAAIVGREKNPYTAAEEIYNWILKEIKFRTGPLKGGAEEALRNREADSYMAALLFCSLGRAAGIPSLPVAGVLVDRNRSAVKHYWAEFWIDGLGWLPVDCALGAGAAPPSFGVRNDRASFYFGSLDNQRIVFSRGQALLSPMDPRGRTAARTRDYAFQNIWEEASGGLESYSSFWGDITITGIYAQ